MNKKLVWVLSIVLVLSILSSESVVGWPYFIEQAWDINRIKFEWDGSIVNSGSINIVCSNSATSKPSLKILATSGGSGEARGPYYSSGGYDGGCRYTPRYTSGGVPVPVTSSNFVESYGSVELRKNGYTNVPVCIGTTNIRIGTNQDGDQDINAVGTFGGYMYVNKKLSSVFKITSQSDSHADWDQNRDVDISSYLNIYNVNQRTPDSSALGTAIDLDSSKSWDYLFANSEGKNTLCSDIGTTYLEPGVYYIMLHAGFDNSDDNNNDWGIMNLIYSNSNSLSNSDYTIYSNPLTPAQIESTYSNDVIDSAFCEAAGGHKDPSLSLHYGCCRSIYNGQISGDKVCLGSQWATKTPTEYCQFITSSKTTDYSPPVQSYYNIASNQLQYIKDTFGGGDGCCGDDTVAQSVCSGTVNCAAMRGDSYYCKASYGCTPQTPTISNTPCTTAATCDALIANCYTDPTCMGAYNGYCIHSNYVACPLLPDYATIIINVYGSADAYYYNQYPSTCVSECGGTWVYQGVTRNYHRCAGSGNNCNIYSQSNCILPGCSYNTLGGFGDYGFISKSADKTQYMCLDKLTLQGTQGTTYKWFDAISGVNSFLISTVKNKGAGVTDVISNSQDWYYCNANGLNELQGKQVLEGNSFPNRYSDGKYSCALLFGTAYSIPFQESCTSPTLTDNCCETMTSPTNTQITRTAIDIDDCVDHCWFKDGAVAQIPPGPNSNSNPGNLPTETDSDVDTDYCIDNPSSCVSKFNADSQLDCALQDTPFTNDEPCVIADNYCANGTFVNSLDSSATSKCCFGLDAHCVAKTSIIKQIDCENAGGEMFVSGSNSVYECSNPSTQKPLEFGYTCCFGTVRPSLTKLSTIAISNNSFICFKEDKNNIFSQCCYDSTCTNKNYWSVDSLKNFDKRVLSRGSSIHTLQNYDSVDRLATTPQLIKPISRKYVLNKNDASAGQPKQIYDAVGKPTNTLGFSYLEFDVLLDSTDVELKINSLPLGKIITYSTNGNRSKVWHHISIPISGPLASQNINIIEIVNTLQPNEKQYVIVDNIALVPDVNKASDLTVNTKPYYCTGGFEGWIKDLDPPQDFDKTNFGAYGPYLFACSGIPSYSWSGTKCCGDDTKRDNDGEYYNDTLSGCFDGTRIRNNSRVSDVKNIWESSNVDSGKDKIQSYEHKDILYLNGAFVGCQLINGEKTPLLYVSTNGTFTTTKLVTQNVAEQCAVRGNYYCMNGAWRQKITTNKKEDEVATSNMQLKIAPSGTELIKNKFS